MTLLEQGFPFDAVSRLVAADRRARDTAYQVHRWWARRPPALVRAALVAAALPAGATMATFRAAYRSEAPLLAGRTVLDPFAGGGTTLVEAARLGACPVGRDIDPLAVLLVGHQLDPVESDAVRVAGRRLLADLRMTLCSQWAGIDSDWTPLHYFTIAVVTCPSCARSGALYRSLVIGRSTGAAGAVVRDTDVSAFCPECFETHSLKAGATAITCCGRRQPLDAATYVQGRYRCSSCGTASDHIRLQTGAAPRAVVGIEETAANRATRRRIRAATDEDFVGERRALDWLAARTGRPLPLDQPISPAPGDARPVSYGIRTVGMLHTARQAAYFAAAHDWLDAAGLDDGTERALRIAVSSTIASNNRLCGYATDYGRLAPLFSIRAFALPVLAVELNPLNPRGGRGTLTSALRRAAKAANGSVRRHVLDGRNQPQAATLAFPSRSYPDAVRAADSTSDLGSVVPLADLCFTDPPYYDFIPYDALSQVFRAWLPEQCLVAEPLLPTGDDPVADFGARLGAALSAAADALLPGGLVAFTYKGGRDAWDAVGVALDEAKLRVTALWPVLADPHMGHHSHPGNCEYDLLIVARAVEQVAPTGVPTDAASWVHRLGTVSASDQANFDHAIRIAGPRWGSPITPVTGSRS